MKKLNVLVTGGAGFIGSNLIEHYLNDDRIKLVRAVDNFSNGYKQNIKGFISNPRFEFIEGDIKNFNTCLKACDNIDIISHQAALGSVPRSIKDPIASVESNIIGTINVMMASVEANVERVILAFSSSTYGDHKTLPKIENIIGNPLSPYAVTKSSIEQFATVLGKTYDIDWIGLRYFNVFGPNQHPNNPYAAVIPIFVKSILNNNLITINGDGQTTRDFTYIDNIIKINSLATFTKNKNALNQIYNAATSNQISLNTLVNKIEKITSIKAKVKFGPERVGDVKHSFASIKKAETLLGYKPEVGFEEGLTNTINWIKRII